MLSFLSMSTTCNHKVKKTHYTYIIYKTGCLDILGDKQKTPFYFTVLESGSDSVRLRTNCKDLTETE